MNVYMARDVVLGCEECGEKMHNVEWQHSTYYSFVCVTKGCSKKGIVQIHGAWGVPIKRQEKK